MSTIKIGNKSAASVQIPQSGQVIIFADSTNSDHISAKDSAGVVFDLTEVFTLNDGSGTTATGTAIDLGGILTDNVIIDGDSGSYGVFLGSLPNQQLQNFGVGSIGGIMLMNFTDNLPNASLGLFSSGAIFGNLPDGFATVFGKTANLSAYDNRTFIIALYGGIPSGSGESFTINGITFTEGIDFVGQNDKVLDLATIAGLNYSGVTDFISLEHIPGNDYVTFNFTQPAETSETFSNGYIGSGLYITEVRCVENGLFLKSGTTELVINNNNDDTIFTDNVLVPKGIQYGADYSANYTSRSLVDKEYVDGGVANDSMYVWVDGGAAGDDTLGDGSKVKPYKTIKKGILMCPADGVVMCRKYDYQEPCMSWSDNTIADNVTIFGEPGCSLRGPNRSDTDYGPSFAFNKRFIYHLNQAKTFNIKGHFDIKGDFGFVATEHASAVMNWEVNTFKLDAVTGAMNIRAKVGYMNGVVKSGDMIVQDQQGIFIGPGGGALDLNVVNGKIIMNKTSLTHASDQTRLFQIRSATGGGQRRALGQPRSARYGDQIGTLFTITLERFGASVGGCRSWRCGRVMVFG